MQDEYVLLYLLVNLCFVKVTFIGSVNGKTFFILVGIFSKMVTVSILL